MTDYLRSRRNREVPFEALNYQAQQERLARRDPVLRKRLIDQANYDRANIDNGVF